MSPVYSNYFTWKWVDEGENLIIDFYCDMVVNGQNDRRPLHSLIVHKNNVKLFGEGLLEAIQKEEYRKVSAAQWPIQPPDQKA